MIYFDVTRLVEWQGRYSGMEVVAYEFALAIHQNKGRLIYFVPEKGFVDVTDAIVWKERSLLYPHVRRGSLKSLAKHEPHKVAGELWRRRTLGAIEPVSFTSDDTFFTSDGLWDREDYIEAVLDVSSMGAKISHLVHDIVPIAVPHLVHSYMTGAMTHYFQEITPVIDQLLSISANTQKDFLKEFGSTMKPSATTMLFHHGDDVPEVTPQRPKMLESIQDFILCVGTIEIRKNHLLLYQTYKLAVERGVLLPPLVIIGRDGWLADQALKLMRDDPAMEGKIIILGPAPDSEMVWCYQNCLFTMMPSLYEGWGLPVAQSLYYGKIAAVSNAGPLPEVGGDLNVYFSPYSPDECLEVVVSLLDEDSRRAKETRIQSQYTTTTWQKAVKAAIGNL